MRRARARLKTSSKSLRSLCCTFLHSSARPAVLLQCSCIRRLCRYVRWACRMWVVSYLHLREAPRCGFYALDTNRLGGVRVGAGAHGERLLPPPRRAVACCRPVGHAPPPAIVVTQPRCSLLGFAFASTLFFKRAPPQYVTQKYLTLGIYLFIFKKI